MMHSTTSNVAGLSSTFDSEFVSLDEFLGNAQIDGAVVSADENESTTAVADDEEKTVATVEDIEKIIFGEEESHKMVVANGSNVQHRGKHVVNKDENAAPTDRIFITRIPDGLKKKDLNDFFCQFGKIVNFHVPGNFYENGEREHKGIAFITYATPEDAALALMGGKYEILPGQFVVVDKPTARPAAGSRWKKKYGGGSYSLQTSRPYNYYYSPQGSYRHRTASPY